MEIAAKCSFVVVITFCLYVTVVGQQTYFDVTSYGAKGNGISDDTNVCFSLSLLHFSLFLGFCC